MVFQMLVHDFDCFVMDLETLLMDAFRFSIKEVASVEGMKPRTLCFFLKGGHKERVW